MKIIFKGLLLFWFALTSYAFELEKEEQALMKNTMLPIAREVAEKMVKSQMTSLNHYKSGQTYYLWKKNITRNKCRYALFEKKSFLKVFPQLKVAITYKDDFYYPLDKNCISKFKPVLNRKNVAELEFLKNGSLKSSLTEIFPSKGNYSFYKISETLLLRLKNPTKTNDAPQRVLFDLTRPAPFLKRGWSCRDNKKSGCYHLLSRVKDPNTYLETYSEEKVAFDEISPIGLGRRKVLPHRFSVYGKAKETSKDSHYRMIKNLVLDRRVKENAFESLKKNFFECTIYSPRSHNTLASECVGQFLDPSLSLNVPTKNRYAACKLEAGDAIYTTRDYYFAADNHYCLLTWYSKGSRWLFQKTIKRKAMPHFLKGYPRK